MDRCGVAEPRFDGLLSLRGVMETGEDEDDADTRALVEQAMAKSVTEALDGLKASRREEGAALTGVLGGLINQIGVLTEPPETDAVAQPLVVKDRFTSESPSFWPTTRAWTSGSCTEAALMAAKADVREELDRLHVQCGCGADPTDRRRPVGGCS